MVGRGKVCRRWRWLDKLKDDLESTIDDPKLIHNESFMMGMMDKWKEKPLPFEDYLTHEFEERKQSYFCSLSKSKTVSLKELRKKLFHPVDQDNKDSTTPHSWRRWMW